MTKWIKCSERLPDKEKKVLVFFSGNMCVGYICKYSEEWHHWPVGAFADDNSIGGISDWSELPEPPNE